MMRRMMCLAMAAICLMCLSGGALAEKGFETLYGLYCSEEVFGEPTAVYDYEGENDVQVCFPIFLFDPENDMTTAILIGENAEGENKYMSWVSDYEPGTMYMTFLLSKFADLKAICEKNVDFCISYSFDGGATMTEFDTAKKAEEFLAALQSQAEAEEAK